VSFFLENNTPKASEKKFSSNFNSNFTGKLGEFVVIICYKLMFYKIIGHRIRNFCGEIDIIAERFNTIVFIEVKSRKNLNMDYQIISQNQIKRITRAADIFLNQNHALYSSHDVRFDLAIVSKLFFPKIIKNAWINDTKF
jgi:putative endonuclease